MERKREADSAPAKSLSKRPRMKAYDSLLHVDHVLEAIHDQGLKKYRPLDADEEKPLDELPILVCVTDQGSDLQAASWFAERYLGLRLMWLYDPRHRLVREQENALKRSGLKASVKLSELLLSFQRGPWQEARWFRILQEEAKEMVEYFERQRQDPSSHPLIRCLAKRIAREQGVPEESLSIPELLEQANFLRSRGEANMSRWDSWHRSFRSHLGEFGLQLFICLCYGLKMNYISQHDGASPLVTPLTSSKSMSGESSSTLQGQQTERERLFQRCKNKFHVVTCLLLNTELMSEIHIWWHASQAMAAELQEVRLLRGRSDCLQWHQQEASGASLTKLLKEIWNFPMNLTWLHSCGLLVAEDSLGKHGSLLVSPDHPLVEQQDDIYRKIVRTCIAATQIKLQSLCHAIYSFPLGFADLLCPAQQKRKLDYMKQVYESWEAIQKFRGPFLDSFKKRSPMQLTFVQTVFRRCKKHGWSLPDDVARVLSDVFSHLTCSWNEEAFSHMRGAMDAIYSHPCSFNQHVHIVRHCTHAPKQ